MANVEARMHLKHESIALQEFAPGHRMKQSVMRSESPPSAQIQHDSMFFPISTNDEIQIKQANFFTISGLRNRLYNEAQVLSPRKQYARANALFAKVPEHHGVINWNIQGHIGRLAGSIVTHVQESHLAPVFVTPTIARHHAGKFVASHHEDHVLQAVLKQALLDAHPENARRDSGMDRTKNVVSLQTSIKAFEQLALGKASSEENYRRGIALFSCMMFLHNSPAEQKIMHLAARHFVINAANVVAYGKIADVLRLIRG